MIDLETIENIKTKEKEQIEAARERYLEYRAKYTIRELEEDRYLQWHENLDCIAGQIFMKYDDKNFWQNEEESQREFVGLVSGKSMGHFWLRRAFYIIGNIGKDSFEIVQIKSSPKAFFYWNAALIGWIVKGPFNIKLPAWCSYLVYDQSEQLLGDIILDKRGGYLMQTVFGKKLIPINWSRAPLPFTNTENWRQYFMATTYEVLVTEDITKSGGK